MAETARAGIMDCQIGSFSLIIDEGAVEPAIGIPKSSSLLGYLT
jgi:hypothetical protein